MELIRAGRRPHREMNQDGSGEVQETKGHRRQSTKETVGPSQTPEGLVVYGLTIKQGTDFVFWWESISLLVNLYFLSAHSGSLNRFGHI